MKKALALLLTLALTLSLLAGCGQTSTDTDTDTAGDDTTAELQEIVITEQVRGYHWAPAYLAQALGFFAEEGLNATFETVQGGDSTAPIFSGDAQFTLKGIESALMINEAGQDCKIILSTTQKYPYQLIGCGEEYTTIESLAGGVVAGGLTTNSGPYSFAMACLNNAGLVPGTDVEISTMASAGYAAAIASGELQGAVSTNPWSAKQLLDLGGVVIVDGTDDAVIEDIIGSSSYELFAVVTSQEIIDTNPELVQKAVNAMVKAMQWMESASAEEIAEQLAKIFECTDEELLYDAQFDKDNQIANYTGYHTASGFAAGVTLTKLAGGITQDFTEDQIYDETFLDAAWAALDQ